MAKRTQTLIAIIVAVLMIASLFILASCGEEEHDCIDSNNNHLCDECNKALSICVDANNDNKCDICHTQITPATGNENEETHDCVDINEDNTCDTCGNTLAKLLYTLKEDNTYEVSGYEGTPTKVVIPATYNGKAVTSIGYGAFYCTSLTSVTIGNSVTSIGERAFSVCTSLTSITIPNSVTSIGDDAFAGCYSLTNVTIPDSVTSLGRGAFGGCISLRNVTLSNSLTIIKESTFTNCYSISSIVIPSSITEIEDFAFLECFKLVEVYNLSSLNIEKGSTAHGRVGIFLKDVYTSLDTPSKLSTDGNGYVIYTDANNKIIVNYVGCETSLVLPNDITEINYAAFEFCNTIITVTIPNSVTSIGRYAFACCDSLTSVNINSIEAWCGITFDDYYANPLNEGAKLYLNGTLVTDLVIPDTVTEIKDYAFSDCTSLTSVTIPNSVTSIGDWAFDGCTSLTSITIPNSVTSIGDGVFYGCDSLTSITIGNSVTSIGRYAFEYCNSLTSITIPNSVTSIGDWAFCGCTSLTSITFEDTTDWYRTTSETDWQNKTGGTLVDVTNPTNNDELFVDNYYNCYWYKK